MAELIPTEDEECLALVDYLELLKSMGKIVVFTHTANETYTKSWNQKIRNKRQGVRSGIQDYIIITPNNVLFLEMKRLKGSTTSQAQKDWYEAVNATGKAKAAICKGFTEAKEWIDKNL